MNSFLLNTQPRLELLIGVTGDALVDLKEFMLEVGHQEEWPSEGMFKLLERNGTYIGLALDGVFIGGAQVLWGDERPYPIEKVFPQVAFPDENPAVTCEVGFIAIDRTLRDGGLRQVVPGLSVGKGADALSLGIAYEFAYRRRGTHLYCMLDRLGLLVFGGRVKMEITQLTEEPAHYWCGKGHPDACLPVFPCLAPAQPSLLRWAADRDTEHDTFWPTLQRMCRELGD